MHVAELWRYPVKSLAGEPLQSAELLPEGMRGDRALVVHDAGGRLVTARTRPGLLGLRARGNGQETEIDGAAWRGERARAAVADAAGEGAELVVAEGEERFDDSPLLVATDGAADAFGIDMRRLRPNIVIGGVEGHAERTWSGRRLRLGGAEVALDELRVRCVVTTFDPDTLEQDAGVLRRIRCELDARIALDARVVTPGRVAVGDPVELV